MVDIQTAFQDKIDGRFPYDDPVEALTLILEARRIAPEACFAVLHEICIPPRSARAGRGRLQELLGFWSQGYVHPLKQSLVHCADALIDGRSIPRAQAETIMKEIASYQDAYNALAIASAAANDNPAGDNESLNRLTQSIQARWRDGQTGAG